MFKGVLKIAYKALNIVDLTLSYVLWQTMSEICRDTNSMQLLISDYASWPIPRFFILGPHIKFIVENFGKSSLISVTIVCLSF